MKRGESKGVKFLRENYGVILFIVIVIGFFAYSYLSKGIIYSLSNSDEQAVIGFINSFGVFSYLAFVILVILEVVLAPIPPLILYVAGGALFGTFIGGLLTLFGNLVGALLAFWIARKLGREFVEKRVDMRLRKKFDNFSQKYGGLSLFILRINPLTTSDLFSYLSGLTSMKLRTFLLGTGLGLAPMIFLQTYLGETFVKTHHTLYVILIWVSILYFLVFFYLIILAFSKKKKKSIANDKIK